LLTLIGRLGFVRYLGFVGLIFIEGGFNFVGRRIVAGRLRLVSKLLAVALVILLFIVDANIIGLVTSCFPVLLGSLGLGLLLRGLPVSIRLILSGAFEALLMLLLLARLRSVELAFLIVSRIIQTILVLGLTGSRQGLL